MKEGASLYIEKFSHCAGEVVKSQRVWYEWNFPAARAKTLRNPRRKRHMHSKNFPAARAKWVRNPIRITDTEVHWFVFLWPLWDSCSFSDPWSISRNLSPSESEACHGKSLTDFAALQGRHESVTYKHFYKMSIFVLQNISGENFPALELLGSKD